MRNLSFSLLVLSLLLMACASSKLYNFNKEKLAIEGYDALSYFEGKPRKGKAEFQTKHKGGIYYFINQVNLDQFKLDPDRYVPAYGGWCAYAIGNSGKKVSINPETFKIKDGKLLLFYNKFGNNTLKKWNEQEEELSSKAIKNWAEIIQTDTQ